MLYNRLAQEMLQAGPDSQEPVAAIGLGRSIFSLLERDPLVHALEVMNHAFARDQAKPALGLMTKLVGSRFIRVNMAPIMTNEEETSTITGFVLSLEDITGEVDADNERDHLLQEITDSIQESLGKLHKGLHAVGDARGSGDPADDLHRQTIASVADDMEERLAMIRKLNSEHARAYGNRENVQAHTLVQLVAKSVEERFSLQAESGAALNDWLKVDSYAIVQTFTNLAGLLKAEHGIQAISFHADDDERKEARITIRWMGQPVAEQTIRDWTSSPLFMDGDGSSDSPDTIISAHDGKITLIKGDGPSCPGIIITLPKALEEAPAELRLSVAPRPVSYEFDLFHQPGQDALGNISLRKLTYVAFDTETTGLNPSEGDEIIQLGAVRIVNSRLLHNECIDQLVNPQRSVPESSVAIHGIDPQLLPSQPVIKKVLTGFHAFASDAVLVAHNAAFDMRFLQLKEEVTGLKFDNPVLDTLLLSSIVHPNQEGHSLDAIAERFNITIVGRHTALGDALVTAEILLKLIPLLEAQGILTLQDALSASLESPFAKISY
jgi:DNA polymerase-3 subunit epsilon